MTEELKAKLELAYNAGVKSVQFNINRVKLIEEGTKSCPAKATFQSYYDNLRSMEFVSNPLINKYLEDEKKFIEEGLIQIGILDVPMGEILNAENAHTYLLKDSGVFLTKDQSLIVIPNLMNEYYTLTHNSSYHGIPTGEYKDGQSFTGNADFIISKIRVHYGK
jgi:hypothetical protein